jgi:hypothetical protein
VVDNWQGTHTIDEICLIQHDWDDSFNAARRAYYGISAMPTIAGNGLQDVWPDSWLEADYQAHAALPSPMTLDITEDSEGTFTVHIEAEEAIAPGAVFCMVATLDEFVDCYGGGRSHLPHHAKVFMTAVTGDPFTLGAGESVDITKSFTVQPDWDYSTMGVGAWVQRPGGFNPSPCPYSDLTNTHGVLQSRWVPTGGTSVADGAENARLALFPPAPNPFAGEARIAFSLPEHGRVSIELYDVAGRSVAGILDETLPAGRHQARWDGTDASGHDCAAGIYFVRMTYEGSEPLSEKLVKLQ